MPIEGKEGVMALLPISSRYGANTRRISHSVSLVFFLFLSASPSMFDRVCTTAAIYRDDCCLWNGLEEEED
jgi:hypothetical protein